VVGIETVLVPADTVESFKITYDVETKMMLKINAIVAEYDKKGNLSATNILVELKK